MWLRIFFFISLLFSALALGAALAHVLALPHKIYLPKEEYFAIQQIYRGWTLSGIGVVVSLISTLILAVMVITKRSMIFLLLAALLCLAGSQAVFWIYAYPVNKATFNWVTQPDNWEVLRNQWEYSHLAGAVLNLVAFIFLVLAVLKPYKNREFVFARPPVENDSEVEKTEDTYS